MINYMVTKAKVSNSELFHVYTKIKYIHILWEMRAIFLTVGERSKSKERADQHDPGGTELESGMSE